MHRSRWFPTCRATAVTAYVSISIGIFIIFRTIYKHDKQLCLRNEYLLLHQNPPTQDAKKQRNQYYLNNDNAIFVPSHLDKKYLKNIQIKYINEELSTLFGINTPNKYILELCTNKTLNKYHHASFYSGSTPQKRGSPAYVGTMGDGRVVTIGQINDIQNNIWELQMKGFGKTSIAKEMFKHKDGKLSLSEYTKELKCWNQLKALHIPTYQILAAVTLSGKVIRKNKKSKQKQIKQAMIGVIRCAPCWFRVGHFEYLYYSDKSNKNTMLWIIKYVNNNIFQKQCIRAREDEILNKYDDIFMFSEYSDSVRLQAWMKDRVLLRTDDIEIDDTNSGENDKLVESFLYNVFKRNAFMMAKWMLNGFVHGMMRSDNIHILGITFDLGTCNIFKGIDDDTLFDELKMFQPGNVEMYQYQYQPECLATNMKRLTICCSGLVKDINVIQSVSYKYWIMFWYYIVALIQRNSDGYKQLNIVKFESLLKSKTLLVKFNAMQNWLIDKYILNTL